MTRCRRRRLLTATSSLLPLGIAGCLTNETDESGPDKKPDSDEESLSSALADPLSLLPERIGDVESVHAVTPSVFDGVTAVQTAVNYQYFAPVDELSAIDWLVEITPVDGLPIRVVTGEISTDSYTDDQHVSDRNGLSLYELDTAGPGVRTAAFTDGFMIHSSNEQAIETVVDAAGREDTDTLLATHPELEQGLARLGGYDSRWVEPATRDIAEPLGIDTDTAVTIGKGKRLLDDDRLERHYFVQVTDESIITTDFKDRFESTIRQSDGIEGRPTVRSDGAVVSADTTIDLADRRRARTHDSPDLGSESRYDASAERFVIPIVRGDQTPVEELTLKVDGAPYDPEIWADGEETIEEGDEIFVRKADSEPLMEIRLVHDRDTNGSPERTVLNALTFEYDYDEESRSLQITYADEFPLDSAHVYGGVYIAPEWKQRERIVDAVGSKRESGPKPDRTIQPWSETEITDGATATIENINPGDTVAIGWSSVQETSLDAFTVPE
ncbi:hypothetical protein [Natrinema salaciae]|uniref:Uncharacterized protein n=1 Tax=Natrinema salaciae TaxID=1186196 RepID=A0A1H9MR28_9EURY|nr:hypothetical protein [Natrinema salaciae]SER26180.1 hypothetical protein SAMN04489841_3464 [Natrinema salaciae]